MTAVFVHGVPDTAHLWDPVREHLAHRGTRALALPGFGTPLPDGFDATKEAYVEWIIGELEKEPEPVDLVGHDWGCILAIRVASVRPDLVRTWAVGDGPVSADYLWHPLAQIWQTPGAGEDWMAHLSPEPFAADLASHGVPPAIAAQTVARVDDTLKDAMLRLYRSAVHVGAEWEPDLANVRSPGLVFWGVDDLPCPVEFADRLGAATGAPVIRFDAGHWVPQQRPAELAAALDAHWSSADDRGAA